MDATYRQQLPRALQLLADEIEASAGAEIEVIHDPALPIQMIAQPHWDCGPRPKIRYRARIDATSAVYPAPFQILAHELLHLRRQFVDWVPVAQLGIQFHDETGAAVPEGHCGCRADGLTPGAFESLIEHLYIEPALTRYGFSRPDYAPIVETMARLKPRAAYMSERIYRWRYFEGWIDADCVNTRPALKRQAAEIMRREGLLAEAVQLSSRIRDLLTSPDLVAAKTALVLLVSHAFSMPAAAIRMCHFKTDRPVHAKYAQLPQFIQVAKPNGAGHWSMGLAYPAHANN